MGTLLPLAPGEEATELGIDTLRGTTARLTGAAAAATTGAAGVGAGALGPARPRPIAGAGVDGPATGTADGSAPKPLTDDSAGEATGEGAPGALGGRAASLIRNGEGDVARDPPPLTAGAGCVGSVPLVAELSVMCSGMLDAGATGIIAVAAISLPLPPMSDPNAGDPSGAPTAARFAASPIGGGADAAAL